MNIHKLNALLIVVSCFFCTTVCFSQSMLAEDTSQRWLVSELQISGNELISTGELLEKMLFTYIEYEIDPATDKPMKDPTTGMQVVIDSYDFSVLIEIIKKPGEEREVSLKTIQGFIKYVSEVYQNKGYRGIFVYVPKEAVDQEGRLLGQILPIEVIEAKVGEIGVERYNLDRQKQKEGFLSDSIIQSWSPLRIGDVIQKKKLDYFVNLLNLNPDRYVSAVISRSEEPNSFNLTYDVYEANPEHWYLQVDNSGTDERQWSPRVGVTNTNLTGIDDSFSAMYQAPWESDIDDNYALYVSYDLPLVTPRFRINLYGGYSEFDVMPQGGSINFLGRGSFYGSELSYNIFHIDNWFVDITSSLSKENSKVTPDIGLTSDVDIDLWSIGTKIHHSDDMSNTSLTLSRVESMGGSSRNDFTAARPGADPDFTIYNFGASHSQYLETSKVNRVSGSFRWITSNERLVPAKMTTFGGFYSIRGYEEYEIVADGGIIMTGQYEFDLVKYSESLENREANSQKTQENKLWLTKLTPLAFIDFGRAKIKSPVIGEQRVRELCSIGIGVIVEIEEHFSAGIYYGWPLRGTDETDRGNGRINFSCIYRL